MHNIVLYMQNNNKNRTAALAAPTSGDGRVR